MNSPLKPFFILLHIIIGKCRCIRQKKMQRTVFMYLLRQTGLQVSHLFKLETHWLNYFIVYLNLHRVARALYSYVYSCLNLRLHGHVCILSNLMKCINIHDTQCNQDSNMDLLSTLLQLHKRIFHFNIHLRVLNR